MKSDSFHLGSSTNGPESHASTPSLHQRALDSLKALLYYPDEMTVADRARAAMTINELQAELFGTRFWGRAFVDGQWSPWHPIHEDVYRNRQRWPREGYEVCEEQR